uniref:SRCR domain-containing protein n=1 Tax=Astyanax mexicanus TaxID=7994 RepID=A0A3B1KK81_ASTMX
MLNNLATLKKHRPIIIIIIYFFIRFFLSLFLVCCTGSVRLVDGGSRCAGRVEVLHRGQWGTVCGDDWDMSDAAVVCRELGCGEAVDGQVWSEELQCRGNESQIHFCPKSSSLKHNCSHDNDVGLVCAGSVRLMNGGSRCAGRVEVLHRGQWGTVCGNNWDMRDAAVVCRELGCGEAVHAVSESHFGSGSGPIWMDDVDCSGSESTLKNCQMRGWGKHNCNPSTDAGVICSVLLVNGSRCSGRVEVLHGESWFTVCDADFNQDAAVVCRELGCGEAVHAVSESHFGSGSGPIWMDNVHCSGSESTLINCESAGWGKHNCDHSKDAGVICSGKLYH